jgi:phospholipase/carboxylesterase
VIGPGRDENASVMLMKPLTISAFDEEPWFRHDGTPLETGTGAGAIMPDRNAQQGRMTIGAVPPPKVMPSAGQRPLGLGRKRDGLIYLPPSASAPAALVVLLHGAGGTATGMLTMLKAEADASGVILLIPESQRATWDVISGGYGPDIEILGKALEKVFSEYPIDRDRVAIAGFSDGASYALSVGIMNGDIFSHVIAFSPGFMAPTAVEGQPRIYVSHGTEDAVLPIDACSRRIVPQLRQTGYEVLYREFSGGHTVPPEIAREGLDFFLAGGWP